MGARHTRGPWEAYAGGDGWHIKGPIPEGLKNPEHIAVVAGMKGFNALLIAAAPDLLDMALQSRAVLETVLAETTDETARRVIAGKIAKLSEVIAKARGAR